MLSPGFALFGSLWTTWVPVAAGALVASLVIGSGLLYGRFRWQRRRLLKASREEDLPWEDLLRLLEKRTRDRAAAGLPPEPVTEEVFGELLASLPAVGDAKPLELPEDREFHTAGGLVRRDGRRWGNPTDVHLLWPLWSGHLHGLVVNRSTDGLGVFTDREVPPGTPMQIRAAEAPSYVAAVKAEVRHCLQVGKGFLLECQFNDDVPWNARVWFG